MNLYIELPKLGTKCFLCIPHATVEEGIIMMQSYKWTKQEVLNWLRSNNRPVGLGYSPCMARSNANAEALMANKLGDKYELEINL